MATERTYGNSSNALNKLAITVGKPELPISQTHYREQTSTDCITCKGGDKKMLQCSVCAQLKTTDKRLKTAKV